MTLLEYYQQHLGKDVIEASTLYINPFDCEGYGGTEYYDKVVFQDGTVKYFASAFRYHGKLEPFNLAEPWLKIAKKLPVE